MEKLGRFNNLDVIFIIILSLREISDKKATVLNLRYTCINNF